MRIKSGGVVLFFVNFLPFETVNSDLLNKHEPEPTEYSIVYTLQNGPPQGSVFSALLFNIMINDIFSNVEHKIGKSFYDGSLWIRGRNVSCQGENASCSS